MLVCFSFVDPHAYQRHFHLVNWADLKTALNTADFINEEDGQVRAAYEILGYTPVQKSFADARHVISASHPLLPRITVVETGFLISEAPSVPESIPLVDLSSSHQVVEDEGKLDQPEEGFGIFDLANQSEDPSGDLSPALSEVELSSVGTSSQAEMGLKRKPPASLFELLEGQPGKGTQGTPQPNAPSPPPLPQAIQTRSPSSKSQPQSPCPKLPAFPPPALPPQPESTDSKRKRSPKGKETMDGGKSQPSKEREEAPHAKQLKIGHQSKGKETEVQPSQGKGKVIEAQSSPSAWLPAPMLHGGPLLETTSMRDLGAGEGGYVADALGRTMLLPTDMDGLKKMKMQEVFLSTKRYLGMVRLLKPKTLFNSHSRFVIHDIFISLDRLSRPPIGWGKR